MARPLTRSSAATKGSIRRMPSEPNVKPNDSAPDAVLRLRSHDRVGAKIRAILYTETRFQPVTIRDVSRGGAGLENCGSLIQDDLVKISLLNGRVIEARVRWWVGGMCGVQFMEPLPDDDALLTGRLSYTTTIPTFPSTEDA